MIGKLKRMLLVVSLMAIVEFTMSMPIKAEAASNVALTQLKQKFPSGKYWNHAGKSTNSPDGYTSIPCTHHGNCSKNGYSGWCGCNSFGSSIQCFGFANKLAYDAYGSFYTSWGRTNLNNLKAGDVIRYKNDGHSIFVTGISGDTITYGDCNSDGHCIIRWDAKISKSTVAKTLTAVYSAPAELSINSGNNNGFGYDYPLNNQEIMDDNFRFQGWVKTSKKIKDITCSVNDGEHYVTAGLYTRPDVPGATAFLTNVSSNLLNYGINKISVCVNYTDGTGEVAGVRTVRRIKPKVLCGYDYPTDCQTITDNEFLFQGWVSVDKTIKNITCSINDGEHYIIANVYDRPDVPYARAFRATINSELLNYGNNYVSVCVNYTDGTGETVGRRVVNKNIIDALDFPAEEAVVTNDDEVLLQGWSYSGSKHIDHFVYWLNGESYQMNAYVRDDLLEGARAFRKKIPNIQFANGENVIRVDAWYSDGTVRQVISRRINGDFRVKKVTLDKTNITLTRKGEAVSLVATVEPSNAGNNAITWCSSNAAVATVNNSGVVTAVSHGTAIITAKTSDGNKTAESRVTVNILVELKEAALETTNYIYDGVPKTPAVTVKNRTTTLVKGTDYEITYSNNINAGIATATIIGKGNYTGTIRRSFTINKANHTITARMSTSTIRERATAQITTEGQGTKIYNSSNLSVAAVNSSGVVTGKAAGTAIITVTEEETSNYFSATATVAVTVTHAYGSGTITKEATCTQDGICTYTCSGCGKTYTEAIRAKGHSYRERVTEATCTERGYTTHTCSACGDSYRNLYVDALGHHFDNGAVTKAATADTDGIRTYTCSRCHTIREEVLPATGHTYDNGTITKGATCTEAGIRTYRCLDCGRTYTEDIPSSGHQYEAVEMAPSCVKKGYMIHTCTICGDNYRDNYTDVTGHDYGEREVVEEPTCTEEGLQSYTCIRCQNQYMETLVATGHRWNDGEITTSATRLSTGIRTYICEDCGEMKIETIPVLSEGKVQKPSNPKDNTHPKGNQKEYRPVAGETVSVDSSCYRVAADGKTVEYADCLLEGVTFIWIPKEIVLHGIVYPVTGVADRAFGDNRKLKEVLISEGIRVIGDGAFENCKSLKKVTIPSSVEKIGKRAFYGCRKLVTLTIKTKKLTKKNVGVKAFTKAGSFSYKKLKVKVPKVKKKAYKRLLKKKGLSPKAKMK